MNGIRLGDKKTELNVDYLAYAENLDIAIKQTEVLKEVAEKGLQISLGKTKYMKADTKDPIWIMRTKYGDTERTNGFVFTYFGGILTLNINKKKQRLKNGQEKWNWMAFRLQNSDVTIRQSNRNVCM